MVKAPSERAVRLEWALEEASAAAARGAGGGGEVKRSQVGAERACTACGLDFGGSREPPEGAREEYCSLCPKHPPTTGECPILHFDRLSPVLLPC